jgi:arginyl-tRNA synthetase
MKASVISLGFDEKTLIIEVIQLVRLIKDGVELKMSKRLGTAFTIREMVEEAGADATRFFLVNRTNESKVDFNINLAKENTSKNPVFYIQYAHARINQIINKSKAKANLDDKYDFSNEKEMVDLILRFPNLISDMAQNHKVHLLTQYLINVAKTFHHYYNEFKIIDSENESSKLYIIKCVQQIIKNGLQLIGIKALERM